MWPILLPSSLLPHYLGHHAEKGVAGIVLRAAVSGGDSGKEGRIRRRRTTPFILTLGHHSARLVTPGLQAVLPQGRDGDFAGLAGVFEGLVGDNPDRAELLRSGITACETATGLRAQGVAGGKDKGGRFQLTEG